MRVCCASFAALLSEMEEMKPSANLSQPLEALHAYGEANHQPVANVGRVNSNASDGMANGGGNSKAAKPDPPPSPPQPLPPPTPTMAAIPAASPAAAAIAPSVIGSAAASSKPLGAAVPLSGGWAAGAATAAATASTTAAATASLAKMGFGGATGRLHGSVSTALAVLLVLCVDAAQGARPAHPTCPSEWVDVDTPHAACTSRRERDGQILKLVFSDEFDPAGRSVRDGEDARWTALES